MVRDDHVDSFCRKNDRLRFSHYPIEPTKNDDQDYNGYIEELSIIKEREQFIDGLHVKSQYTSADWFKQKNGGLLPMMTKHL